MVTQWTNHLCSGPSLTGPQGPSGRTSFSVRDKIQQSLPESFVQTIVNLLRKYWVSCAVVALLIIQVAQFTFVVHRESLTFDEGDHSFSGYMMWKTGDYGLNPEHPPLVKLLAAIPTIGKKLWTPPLQGRFFKSEAYTGGRDWLARNDGGSQHLVFRMRMMTGILAVGLSLVVFFVTREFFGTGAALFALVITSFDPNILATPRSSPPTWALAVSSLPPSMPSTATQRSPGGGASSSSPSPPDC
jgi:hypothetical protein